MITYFHEISSSTQNMVRKKIYNDIKIPYLGFDISGKFDENELELAGIALKSLTGGARVVVTSFGIVDTELDVSGTGPVFTLEIASSNLKASNTLEEGLLEVADMGRTG